MVKVNQTNKELCKKVIQALKKSELEYHISTGENHLIITGVENNSYYNGTQWYEELVPGFENGNDGSTMVCTFMDSDEFNVLTFGDVYHDKINFDDYLAYDTWYCSKETSIVACLPKGANALEDYIDSDLLSILYPNDDIEINYIDDNGNKYYVIDSMMFKFISSEQLVMLKRLMCTVNKKLACVGGYITLFEGDMYDSAEMLETTYFDTESPDEFKYVSQNGDSVLTIKSNDTGIVDVVVDCYR